MVSQENPTYLFIGQDIIGPDGSSHKDTALERIKKEYLSLATRDFNTDILYAKDFDLRGLQERLLGIPAGSKKRLLVIKDAQLLKDDILQFILSYIAKPRPSIVLVLDFIPRDNGGKEESKFIADLRRHACVMRFKETRSVNTFDLCREIESRKTTQALYTLKELFENGERAERILGGLRSNWERNIPNSLELKKRLKLLLSCDIDIKTGRVNPEFVLERLIVYLCGSKKSAH